jgi:hypothetical protein
MSTSFLDGLDVLRPFNGFELFEFFLQDFVSPSGNRYAIQLYSPNIIIFFIVNTYSKKHGGIGLPTLVPGRMPVIDISTHAMKFEQDA